MGTAAYDKVTEAIIQRLEAGVIPWHCPWSGVTPRNLSGREYHGINVMLLAMQGYPSPYWLTFKQCESLGGKVRKGAKGTPVVFWRWIESKDEVNQDTGEPKRIPFLRYHTVFNLEQTEGIPAPESDCKLIETDPIEEAERIVAGYPAPPTIYYRGGQACYKPLADIVEVPERKHFESMPAFYDTLFHELVHSTGHASRLARKSLTDHSARFGSDPYAREELVAEIGAAFLCHEAGIDHSPILENEAAYIASWLRRLKNDSKLVVIAASQAQKAAEHILNVHTTTES